MTHDLVTQIQEARRHTLSLVADLADAQLEFPYQQAVNPFRWEMGHVAFFYDVFLLPALGREGLLLEGAESYYDSFRVDHPDRWTIGLPSRAETLAYMERVQSEVTERLSAREPTPQEAYLSTLCTIHEDMHGEAFTYMRHTLGYGPPALGSDPPDGAGPWPGDVEVPGGRFELGAARDAPFVFDNEKWAHPVDVAPFRIARAPVTNAEFAAFVDDGGYERDELWDFQARRWRTKANRTHPVYWQRDGDGWLERVYDRTEPLRPHVPVMHVSWYAAQAYCRWAKRRLPTEAEWELAALGSPSGPKRLYPWGDSPPGPEHANLDARGIGRADVAAFPAGDSAFGCRQMMGNVWEWTSTPFYPFPGYVVDTPYREYSAPWFGSRKVLRGGAWATRARLARATYRNFFDPFRVDVYCGFRTCDLD